LLLAGAAWANGPAYLPTTPDGVALLSWRWGENWSEVEVRGSRNRADGYRLDETILAPGLHLEGGGSIYHERLLEFSAAATLSLQRRRLSGDLSASDDLSFQDYDASVCLLGCRADNLRLFARRHNAWLVSPFRSSTRTATDLLGGELALGSLPLPVTVAYSRERTGETFLVDRRTSDRRRWRAGTRWHGRRTGGSLLLRHERFVKTLPDQDYATVGATLDGHVIPRGNVRLRSHVRYFHQYGTLDRRDITLRETLAVPLRRHLDARLSWLFHSLRSGGGDAPWTRSSNGGATFRHRLYGSLETTLRLDLQDERTYRDGDGGREQIGSLHRRGGELRLDYRRRTRYGLLRLGYGRSRWREEQAARETQREAADERHVLDEGEQVPLAHLDVVPGSVVVTDDTGFVLYVEGIDYRLDTTGRITLLSRLPGGDIPDGGAVLVDYRYTMQPELTFDTTGRSWLVRFDAHRLVSVHYRHRTVDEEFVSGTPGAPLQDQERDVYGLELNWRRLALSEEIEDNRLADARFHANRLRLTWHARLGPRTRLTAGAGRTWTRYRDPERTYRFRSLDARLVATPGAATTVEAAAWLRLDRGSDYRGDLANDLLGLRLDARYRLRALTLTAGIAYRDSDANDVQDRRFSFRCGARRRF